MREILVTRRVSGRWPQNAGVSREMRETWQVCLTGMAKYITGLTGVNERDGLRPMFYLHSFLLSTFDMAYSAIYDPLNFHFDVRDLMAKLLLLLLGTRRLDSAIDQKESVDRLHVAE